MSRAEAMREARKIARQFQADREATAQTRAFARLLQKLKRNRAKVERVRGDEEALGLSDKQVARAKALVAELRQRQAR